MSKKKKKEKSNKTKKIQEKERVKVETRRNIAAILLFLLGVLFVLGFIEQAGIVGRFFNKIGGLSFGWGKWLFPLMLFLTSLVLLFRKKNHFYITKIAGLILVFFGFLGLFHFTFSEKEFLAMAKAGKGGGFLGYLLAIILLKLTGKIAGIIILIAFALIGIILAFNFSLSLWLHKVVNFWKDIFKKDNELEDPVQTSGETKINIDTENLEDENNHLETNVLEKVALSSQGNKEKNEKKISDLTMNSQKKITKAKQINHSEQSPDKKNNIKNIKFLDESEKNNQLTNNLNQQENLLGENSFQENNLFLEENKTGKKKKDFLEWKMPPFNLVEGSSQNLSVKKNTRKELKEKQARIVETLKHFDIIVKPVGFQEGPTVIQYTFSPAMGVKLSKITSLSNDLALALAAHSIRIEAPIPGKSLIGIEVPNTNRSVLMPREILKDKSFQNFKGNLPIALGEDINGKYVVSSLAQMPHLLIAGTTGSGKSVTMNATLLSLLYKNSPEDLKLILIDPKRVEFSYYDNIPHLVSNVIKDQNRIMNALKWTIEEMKKRYKLIELSKSRDIESYNEKAFLNLSFPVEENGEKKIIKKMSYIVVVIDELAEIIINHKKEVESYIVQIAQMGRAAGIHLIISTQKPKAEIVTSLIKSNIPSRIALHVPNQIDSRTIIDRGGAEKLLGKGDLLFLGPNTDQIIRLQGIYVSEKDIKAVTDFWKKQGEKIKLKQQLTEKNEDNKTGENKEENENKEEKNDSFLDGSKEEKIDFNDEVFDDQSDELYLKAKEVALQAGEISASLLQRRLSIGYPRAARLIDTLEEKGVIGPPQGFKPRKVISNDNDKDQNQKNFSNEIDYQDSLADQSKRDKWQI